MLPQEQRRRLVHGLHIQFFPDFPGGIPLGRVRQRRIIDFVLVGLIHRVESGMEIVPDHFRFPDGNIRRQVRL